MNLRTTIALLVLAAAGGAALWFGASLPPALDPLPRPAPAADAGSRAVLEQIKPAKLTAVEIDRAGRPAVKLERSASGWTMPGNWPVSAVPVNELTTLLGGLRPRFEPIPVNDAGLGKYGLGDPAAVVKLTGDDGEHTLAFGRKPSENGNPFTQETYVRVDDKPEVLRLAPGLIDELDRPADYYQERRLFPHEREAKDETNKEKVDRLEAKSVAVEDKKEGGSKFALTHAADGWELSAPTRDRLAPAPRDALLAAVQDIWAERFSENDVAAAAAAPAVCDGGLPGALSGLFWAGVNTPVKLPQWLLTRAGLDDPERTVSVTRDDGSTVTLLIGKSAGTRPHKVMRPAPPGVPAPPTEVDEPQEFLYARLKDNPQVFEIQADKLKDVFVATDALRDPQLAHFSDSDATRLEITQNGQEIVLVKDKERWSLDKPLHADADRQKVSDLLNRLSGLEARSKDVHDGGDPKAYGLDTPAAVVKVTVEEKVKNQDEAKEKGKTKTRVLTFRLGKRDDATKQVYVQVDDWPRVNAVTDGGSPGDAGLSALAKRDAREYRGKRLFDFSQDDLASVSVLRDNDPAFLFQNGEKGDWRLNVPADVAGAETDPGEASKLANSLSNLEVLEYVNDAPKADELEAQYGLGKPPLAIQMRFADKAKAPRTLHVGKARGDKPGRFARLADTADGPPTAVFAIADDAFRTLDRDALAYLPRQPWKEVPGDVTAVRIRRQGQDEYILSKAGAGWKVGGPFEADAAPAAAQALAAPLAAPNAESYKAFAAKNPAEYGLDVPYLTAVLTAKDGKVHTLTVGGPTAKDAVTRYARADGNQAVFVVAPTLVAAVDKPALDLLDPTLFRLGSGRLEQVRGEAKAGDKEEKWELKPGPKGWQMAEGPGAPFAADPEAVDRLQGLWSDLRAVRFADYGPRVKWETYGLAAPTATVTVGVKKDDAAAAVEHTIRLGGPADGGGRYAHFDDRPGAAVLDAATAHELSLSHLDFVDRTVFDFDANAVAGLSLQTTDGRPAVALAKGDDGWKLTGPKADAADEKSVQELVGRLAKLRAERVADHPAGKLDTFGLAKPEASATVTLKADAKTPKAVLLIGKAVDAPDGDRFAMAEGGKAVVVIPAALARRLTSGPLAFRDRSLLKVASGPDRVRLDRDPRKAVFAKVEGSWKMTEPVKADLDQDALDDFLNSLLTLRADELVSEKPTPEELKSYGLDNPEAKWRLQNGDKDLLTLLVGKTEKGGRRAYARLADRDLVFLLDPGLTAKALGEYRTRTVWVEPLDAVQVVGLKYKRSGGSFELAKGDDGWKGVGKPDARIDGRTVEETLAALAGLKLERYIVDKDANLALFGLAPPELTVEVGTKTGRTFTLQLGRTEGDSKRRYAHVPEAGRTDVFVLSEADGEKIVRDLAAFGKPPAALPALPMAP